MFCLFSNSAKAVELVDMAGRTVTVPDRVERIVLGEGRLAYALALLDRDDPFKRIVAWQNDLHLMDPHTYETYATRFPEVRDIALIGQASEQSVSVEKILAMKPDLAVFSLAGHGPSRSSEITETLMQAGVPVIFVDFRVDPMKNTRASITLLGRALGRERQAGAYIDFYDAHLRAITHKVATLPAGNRSTVFIELLAGAWQAPGHTTGDHGMGEFITLVGSHNIVAGKVPGALGDVSVEYVLRADPDIYIATGNRDPGLLLGPGVTSWKAETSLTHVLARPEFAPLRAIKTGAAHGLWHDFYASPYNILAIETLAKWVHPALFADLDPGRTKTELFKTFLPFEDPGTYWVSAVSHAH
jgi:iron complex transport system substrate-binding protein